MRERLHQHIEEGAHGWRVLRERRPHGGRCVDADFILRWVDRCSDGTNG
jgi:hypothetical protein